MPCQFELAKAEEGERQQATKTIKVILRSTLNNTSQLEKEAEANAASAATRPGGAWRPYRYVLEGLKQAGDKQSGKHSGQGNHEKAKHLAGHAN